MASRLLTSYIIHFIEMPNKINTYIYVSEKIERLILKKITNFFQAQDEEEHQDYLDQELWIKDNFTAWKQEKEDEMRAKMVQSGRYKQYKRYMRNHGPDRMTFDDS